MGHTPSLTLSRPWVKGKILASSFCFGEGPDLLALHFHGQLSSKHPAVIDRGLLRVQPVQVSSPRSQGPLWPGSGMTPAALSGQPNY